VRKLGPYLEWVIGRSTEEAVATQPVEGSGIDCADGMKRIATRQRKIGETQHGNVARVRRAAIQLLLTSNQAAPYLLHGVGVAERHARNAAAH
jgi:hypothetical protein